MFGNGPCVRMFGRALPLDGLVGWWAGGLVSYSGRPGLSPFTLHPSPGTLHPSPFTLPPSPLGTPPHLPYANVLVSEWQRIVRGPDTSPISPTQDLATSPPRHLVILPYQQCMPLLKNPPSGLPVIWLRICVSNILNPSKPLSRHIRPISPRSPPSAHIPHPTSLPFLTSSPIRAECLSSIAMCLPISPDSRA
jgi:hypothetical protein